MCMQPEDLLAGTRCSLAKLIYVLLMSASTQCNQNYMGYEIVKKALEGLIQLISQ